MSRRPARLDLTDELSLELGARFELVLRLRERDPELTTYPVGGAVVVAYSNLAPYDPSGSPAGLGYQAELLSAAGGTLLATLPVAPRGERASGTLTFADVPGADETVDVGGIRYTWKAAPSAAYEVAIGATAAGSAANLLRAVNGELDEAETLVGPDTPAHPAVVAIATSSTVLSIEARDGGAWGNGVALASSDANVTASAAALAGGTGQDGLLLTADESQIPVELAAGRSSASLYYRLLGLLGDGSPDVLAFGRVAAYA